MLDYSRTELAVLVAACVLLAAVPFALVALFEPRTVDGAAQVAHLLGSCLRVAP